MVAAAARRLSPPILSAFSLKHLDSCSFHEYCHVFVLPPFRSRLLLSTSTIKHSIHRCFFLISASSLRSGVDYSSTASKIHGDDEECRRGRSYKLQQKGNTLQDGVRGRGCTTIAGLGDSKYQMTRKRCRVLFALNTGGGGSFDAGDGRGSLDGDNAVFGRTRLGVIASAAARELLEKLNSARKNFPIKIFLLLLGFYTANALATILGQTGDWDVLVAGVVVAAIEAIGMLMYRMPSRIMMGRFRALTVFVNYWKAGVCLGLFVDAFKLGS